jgi:hypothetical protein
MTLAPTCPVANSLSRLERRYRARLNSETRVPLQIVFGQIALEVQRKRFKHESRCVRCRRNESAPHTYRFSDRTSSAIRGVA